MTAVQWLILELKDAGFDHIDYANEIINKAIELEKQQIIDAYLEGFSAYELDANSEQYYENLKNETK